jgi:hypothetical protein
MNIDSMLRQTLHSHADEAPPSAGLLDAAQARAHRRRSRHAIVAAAVAVGAGLVAVSIPFGASVGEGPTVPGSGPPTFPPVALVEPSFELPSFPFTPGWVPDGVEAQSVTYDSFGFPRKGFFDSESNGVVEMPGGNLGLAYEFSMEIWERGLEVAIHSEDPTVALEGLAPEPITVHGRPGKRYQVADVDEVVVAWQHEPDQWVTVWGLGIDAQEVERYSQELEETPIRPQAPFTFGLLPAGVQLTGFGPDWMRFHGENGVGVTVSLVQNAPAAVPPGSPAPTPTGEIDGQSPPPPQPTVIVVGGRTAALYEWSEGPELHIDLGDDWVLEVWSTRLNPDDLVRIAEGIEFSHP